MDAQNVSGAAWNGAHSTECEMRLAHSQSAPQLGECGATQLIRRGAPLHIAAAAYNYMDNVMRLKMAFMKAQDRLSKSTPIGIGAGSSAQSPPSDARNDEGVRAAESSFFARRNSLRVHLTTTTHTPCSTCVFCVASGMWPPPPACRRCVQRAPPSAVT